VSNACGVGKNRAILTNSWLSINDQWSAEKAATVDGAVYHTDSVASVNLCLSQPTWKTTTKRTEFNCTQL